MGLDLLIYKYSESIPLVIIQFPEKLHISIFNSEYYGTCKILRKLKDFYKTDLKLQKAEDIKEFINDLAYIKKFLVDSEDEINKIIEEIKDDKIYMIRITGD